MPDLAATLRKDAGLGEARGSPTLPAPRKRLDHVLVTGVTGFLGGEIAAALIGSTAARLHCLVRGDTRGGSAGDRLAVACRRLGIDPGRVELVEGDLTSPSAALADEELARRIDTVVHCAASVNLFAPYAALREPNVLAARAVLDFAARGTPKAVHFVSTVGVFFSPRYRARTVFEDEIVRGEEGLRNGYAQSKWVADTMMAGARSRGLAINIYRPAFVGWHSQTGHHGERDLVALLLRSSLEAGVAPRLDLQINSAPVDHVAETMVKLMGAPAARGGTYHLTSRRAVPFVELAAMAGLPLCELPAWQAAVGARAPRFAKLAAMVCASQGDEDSGSAELHLAHDRTYDDDRLRQALGPAYRPAPPTEAAYVSRFIRSVAAAAAV